MAEKSGQSDPARIRAAVRPNRRQAGSHRLDLPPRSWTPSQPWGAVQKPRSAEYQRGTVGAGKAGSHRLDYPQEAGHQSTPWGQSRHPAVLNINGYCGSRPAGDWAAQQPPLPGNILFASGPLCGPIAGKPAPTDWTCPQEAGHQSNPGGQSRNPAVLNISGVLWEPACRRLGCTAAPLTRQLAHGS